MTSPSKPKRPCKEPGCNNMGFIYQGLDYKGPLIECPKCVTPFRKEHRRDAAPPGTRENNWGMPVADEAKTAGPHTRLPSTKAAASRQKQNEQAYGFKAGS